MQFDKRIVFSILIISISIKSTEQNSERKCGDLTCYECEGDLGTACSYDQKKNKNATIVKCSPETFGTSIAMCGTRISNSRKVTRGCFPGTGEMTCFKNHDGFQCVCSEECNCNSGIVKK